MNNFEHLDKYREDKRITWLAFKLFGIIDLFHGTDPGRKEFANRIATHLENGGGGKNEVALDRREHIFTGGKE